MKVLDQSFLTPEQNLACDEALLETCEGNAGGEILRFWESSRYFAVVGYSNKVATEIQVASCRNHGVPVLRRCSGGGTVLQGPGCLNYSLILKTSERPECRSIKGANAAIMERHREAFQKILGRDVVVAGHTDLAVGGRKFSGNSQRRKRHALLFHGTFLLNFDLSKMEKYLRMPTLEPAYRDKRPHTEFLTNLSIGVESVKEALKKNWAAKKVLEETPLARIQQLASEVYSSEKWNFKF